jgi:perosamine synthetase
MNNEAVIDFERAFAAYVGGFYAIALNSGTATLHTALAALGGEPGDHVEVPPLTMASTTIAVLHAGGVPVFVDVDPDTWLMVSTKEWMQTSVPVSLYGLHQPHRGRIVDDAAQTLRPHSDCAFTSYSFQASKILALGEGGMLVTDDPDLAVRAREFSSLGYRMGAGSPVINKRVLKDPAYARHRSLGWNYRMAGVVAEHGLKGELLGDGGLLGWRLWDIYKAVRQECAALYREAVAGCPWIVPQHVPEGWTHDYWCYAVALEHAELWAPFVDSVERNGGERPYAAWRLTYQEPAFRHLADDGCCPVAEDLQPRLVQGQTNDLESAKRNAGAWAAAILEVGGVPA